MASFCQFSTTFSPITKLFISVSSDAERAEPGLDREGGPVFRGLQAEARRDRGEEPAPRQGG